MVFLSPNNLKMSGIIFITDTEIITVFSILSIILLKCIVVFQLLKYYYLINSQIKSLFEKLSYLFFGYIFILQGGILYHVNYLQYSFSGSEGNMIPTEESHPIVTFIIILLVLSSILMTCISVISINSQKDRFSQEEIDMLEYKEYP